MEAGVDLVVGRISGMIEVFLCGSKTMECVRRTVLLGPIGSICATPPCMPDQDFTLWTAVDNRIAVLSSRNFQEKRAELLAHDRAI